MEPITRQEQLLDSIATGNSVDLEPITREEQYLSAIAGSTDFIPEKPITRKEMFYEKILESGGVGGDGTAKPTQTKTIDVVENGTYKVTPDSGKVLSSVTANVDVPERYEEGFQDGVDSVKLQEKTATENGVILPDEGFSGMSKVTVDVPASGGGKEEQEKTVTITENGTTEVTPDEGKTLSKVTVETSVSGSGEIGKPYIDTSMMTNFDSFVKNNPVLTDYQDKIDTSNGTNFSYMFSAIDKYFTVLPLDTSNGTNFSYMFFNNPKLRSVPQIDTSKGTNFRYMYNNTRLTTIPPLDTSNGTDFFRMFEDCSKLTTIPPLDTSNGTNFSYMFYFCTKLETVSLTTAKSDLNTTTFQNCTALTNLTIGEGWAVSIYLTYSNNLTVESLHGMIENLADLTGATAKTFSVGETNLAKIDEEHIAMLQAKNWNYS